MRKCLIPILLMIFAFSTQLSAQGRYKPWKVDVGVLVGEITEHNVGVLFPYVEPKYNITDNFAVGLRSEYILFSKKGFVGDDPGNPHLSNFDADGGVLSFAFTGDVYFTNNTVRPFVGLGGGYYFVQVKGQNNFLDLDANLNTGGILWRAGLNMGHFRVAGEYNSIFSTEVNVNYFSIKLGYEIGGGKKRFW